MIRTYQTRIDVIRNGATFTTLHPVSPATIDCDSSAEIKTSLTGTFRKNTAVNWLTDELKPYQIINGHEFPVGIFMAASVLEQVDANGAKTISVEAFDRCLRLRQSKTETMLHIPAGTNYISAIEGLLVGAGIALWRSTPTTKTTATDREDWPIGTSYLKIINTLLWEIGYGSIWFDAKGFAILCPTRVTSVSNIDHRYGSEEDVRLLESPYSQEVDIFDTPNVFIAICENPDLPSPLIATAVNDNPVSSLSVFRRGRRIVQTYKVNNVPDQGALDAHVQQLMQTSMLSEDIVSISTANVPNHMVYDTVALTHPDISGLFQEVAWHLTLAPGQLMKHTLRRLVFV